MTTAQNALEPAKVELHAPAVLVPQSDQLWVKVHSIGRQLQDFWLAFRIDLARRDLNNAQWCLY